MDNEESLGMPESVEYQDNKNTDRSEGKGSGDGNIKGFNEGSLKGQTQF